MGRMRLEFVQEGIVATARLFEREAPETSKRIWDELPFEGQIQHGQWSGPEAYLLVDPTIRIEAEYQASICTPGDIGFYSQKGGVMVDWPNDISELCFMYGRGARPSMIDGPVAVNLFAQVDDNLEGFAEACRRLRTEGVQRFRVGRLE